MWIQAWWDNIYKCIKQNIWTKEIYQRTVKKEERIISLEQNVKEIKADKQQISESIKTLSAELNKFRTICENFKSPH